jgi:hypothetical protein
MALLSILKLDVEEALNKAIDEVLARDWKEYPLNGTGK